MSEQMGPKEAAQRAMREANYQRTRPVPVKRERPKLVPKPSADKLPVSADIIDPSADADRHEIAALRAQVAKLTLALAERDCPTCVAKRKADAERKRAKRMAK